MNFQFHNKLEITIGEKTYTFYNTMLKSVLDALENFKPYASHIAIGTGTPQVLDNNRLVNYLQAYILENNVLNSDVSSNNVFAKRSFYISNTTSTNPVYITEIGLTNTTEQNPVVFNYISLINSDFPNGVPVYSNEKPILCSIYIYLSITQNSNLLFCAGKNKFIEFLLGEGLSGEICCARGNNTSKNSYMQRQPLLYGTKYPCVISKEINVLDTGEYQLSLNFSADILTGKTYELVFLLNDTPFARINLQNHNPTNTETVTLTPKECFVLDLGEDVECVNSIINNSTKETENNFYYKSYAKEFGDKITLPFNNLFNHQTPRFISKDGNKIFFVLNDYIYGYKNEDFNIIKLNCENIVLQQINKIISFENFLFVVCDNFPFLSCYYLNNSNTYENISIQYNSYFENALADILHIDATLSKDNILMLSIILKTNNNGCTFYFDFNFNEKIFTYKTHLLSNHSFSYILAMYKNNFTDAQVMFLEEGDYSSDCRIVTHYSNQTEQDVYSVLGYFYTKDTKEVYVNDRVVVVEKTNSPKLRLFYYPQMYEYELSLISDEDDNYISNNLLYLIQKRNKSYKIYNLVGYNQPIEFLNGFPEYIVQDKIEDFEFLNDTILIFLNDPDNPVVALNLKETNALVENISSTETTYNLTLTKFNILGNNNEGVIANFAIKIKL